MTGDAWDEAQAEIVRLRAEVAALREECEYWREKWPRSGRELAEARALLARAIEMAESQGGASDEEDFAEIRTMRAFLHRDEASTHSSSAGESTPPRR